MSQKQNSEQDFSEQDLQLFIRSARRQICRNAFLATVALCVLVFVCYAWFTRNTSVSGTISSIQVLESRYELAGEGATAEDSGYGTFYNKNNREFTFNTLPAGSVSKGNNSWHEATSGSQQSIRWRLNDNSQIGNYPAGSSGIRPGSKGELKFYVVPKVAGTLNLDFQIDLNPLNDNGSSMEDEQLNKLLKGHLLFYIETEENDWKWISWDGNTFNCQFNITDNNVDVPQPVTLYWMWPKEVSNLVENAKLRGKIAMYRESLLYSADDSSIPSEKEITNCIDNDQLEELATFYNRADRYIGSHLTWLEVKLSARPSADLAAN